MATRGPVAPEFLALAFGRTTDLRPIERLVAGLAHTATAARANVNAVTTASLVQTVTDAR
jgi:hypothetical protein